MSKHPMRQRRSLLQLVVHDRQWLIGQSKAGTADPQSQQGRMMPSGRAAADAAKEDGRWAAAYAPPSEAEVPADLMAAIVADSAGARICR
jgi:uncharacterized protein YdeI (YjbR/CyaY-like superfamily)